MTTFTNLNHKNKNNIRTQKNAKVVLTLEELLRTFVEPLERAYAHEHEP